MISSGLKSSASLPSLSSSQKPTSWDARFCFGCRGGDGDGEISGEMLLREPSSLTASFPLCTCSCSSWGGATVSFSDLASAGFCSLISSLTCWSSGSFLFIGSSEGLFSSNDALHCWRDTRQRRGGLRAGSTAGLVLAASVKGRLRSFRELLRLNCFSSGSGDWKVGDGTLSGDHLTFSGAGAPSVTGLSDVPDEFGATGGQATRSLRVSAGLSIDCFSEEVCIWVSMRAVRSVTFRGGVDTSTAASESVSAWRVDCGIGGICGTCGTCGTCGATPSSCSSPSLARGSQSSLWGRWPKPSS